MAAACSTVTLPSGDLMPMVGLGTFDNLKDDKVSEAVRVAIDEGYRCIDTAYIYRSEGAVGAAIADKIKKGVVTRKDLFVTTKLWNTFHEPDRVEMGMRESLAELKMDYVDLLLMHWPMAFKELQADRKAWILNQQTQPAEVDYLDTWKAMEGLVEKGLARNIGVSNFNIDQLQRLLHTPPKIKPANMQLESHPLFHNQELVDFCRSHGMTVTAFSPLAKGGATYAGKQMENILEDSRVTEIAAKHKRTPAQVVLRMSLQRGICVVPKSCTASRIKENFQIFDFTLSEEEMSSLSSMNKNKRLVTLEVLGQKG
ncbi:aldo-keto reductase family 1 member B1-like isoform X2 [Littorina saxatilis]|uniref:aldo-keto reductase family 1 member B1-like isoform X2 n=1 Tax=Littorina saxatilis TaxID=31220 RepID=UPI0038B6364B